MAMFNGIDIGADLFAQTPPPLKKPKKDNGEPRQYLKVFETAPAQLLNAYGVSQAFCMPDDQVWEHLVKPLPTGAL